ncbi:MAG: hypothetical protein HYX21_00580 [Candidatus Yanofskybacteria bacterium]|nr:hypothetical protein [Candidatus Yanofskybacteria bacterium]
MSWQTLGFQKNKEFFEKIVRNGELGHAYLFTGQEMIGKKRFALDLAGLVNSSGIDFENDPNLLILGGENGISIDQVRDLKKFLSFKPYSGSYKIAVINDCHLMSQEAANALLKVLEEPASHSLIILVTSNPNSLLPTIYSRCEEIKFEPHIRSQLLGHLKDMGLSQTQAEFLADFSNGRPGLAFRLKEKNSFKEIKTKLEQFNKLLKSDINERFNFAEKALQEKEDQNLSTLLLYWMFYLRSDLSKSLKINRGKVLKSLLEVNYILSKPQYNHRLAFENFLLSL